MSNTLTRFAAIALLTLPVASARADELEDVKSRLRIEAQRVEQEFTAERAAAYRLVREDGSRLRDATEKLQRLIGLVRNDTSLPRARREVLLVTLSADLGRVRDIADARAGSPRPTSPAVDRRPPVKTGSGLPRTTSGGGKDRVDDLTAMLDRRKGVIHDKALARLDKNERFSKTVSGVEDAAVPETLLVKFPANWKELSAKRSSEVKMTEMERTIMKALATPIEVEYRGEKFQDVLDHLRKVTGLPISADKRALEESNVTYETPIDLKARSTSRTVLKKLLGALNLTYVIKDETVLITSRERAASMTVTKSYYLGDLVGVVGVNLDPVTSQLIMLERVNGVIALLQSKVDPQSWRTNNPDAPGVITFYPPTMSLIVKQTAEWHFMNHGK